MQEVHQEFLTGERALFMSKDLKIFDTIFTDGESPLKESRNIEVYGSSFKWKYPFWYCKDITVKDSTFFEMARAGIWYTDNITVENCMVEAPKEFRRCDGVKITNVSFSNAAETLWNCKNVELKDVVAKGDYFAMNMENAKIDNLRLYGNYSFDGAKNITFDNCKLLSKDAVWNSENVTIRNSYICGEYLGWNSKNLTFVNCTIESLQGLCYIDNLKMENCKLINTTLAFEFVSNVDAEITTEIGSVLNPISGTITAPEIETLIVERDFVDPEKTKIVCKAIGKTEEVVEWRRTN